MKTNLSTATKNKNLLILGSVLGAAGIGLITYSLSKKQNKMKKLTDDVICYIYPDGEMVGCDGKTINGEVHHIPRNQKEYDSTVKILEDDGAILLTSYPTEAQFRQLYIYLDNSDDIQIFVEDPIRNSFDIFEYEKGDSIGILFQVISNWYEHE